MKSPCKDIKKIIWTKWGLSAYTKGAIKQTQRQPQRKIQMRWQRQVERQSQRLLRAYITFFLREQLGKMTGEDPKSYYSIVSTRCRKIKEDPARLFAYNNRAMQMRNEAEKPSNSGDDPLVDSTV